MTKVFLITEHRLLRDSMVRVLEKGGEISVVGTSRCCDALADEVIRSACEVLLLDGCVTEDAEGLVAELLARAPATKIVLIGMEEDGEVFLRLVRRGISGFLLGDASAGETVAAVRAVSQGEAVCPPRLCKLLFERMACEPGPSGKKLQLTGRQSQVVALLSRGLTNKEIASTLHLSEFTVKNHLRRIMRYLGASSRRQVVEMAGSSPSAPSQNADNFLWDSKARRSDCAAREPLASP